MREGEIVQLTPKCFEILLVLIESSGQVIGKERLIERVWPSSFVEEGNLTYNISILRKVLGERAGEHQYIATIPGQGYQFVANVTDIMNRGADTLAIEHSPTGLNEASSGRGLVREEAGARLPESFLRRIVRHKRRLMIAAVVLVMAAAGISFGLYKLISGSRSQTNSAEPFHKMKITRLTTTGKATVADIGR